MSSMHTMKMQRPSTMLSDVRQLLATGGGLNQANDDGVTLVTVILSVTISFFRFAIITSSSLLSSSEAPHSMC